MPPTATRYTIMTVPNNGLFYVDGRFMDGGGKEFPDDRGITLFTSRAEADRACRRLKQAHESAELKFVTIRVHIRDRKSKPETPAEDL